MTEINLQSSIYCYLNMHTVRINNKIKIKAIIEALPPNNSIVRIEEKIIINVNDFTAFNFVLNVK